MILSSYAQSSISLKNDYVYLISLSVSFSFILLSHPVFIHIMCLFIFIYNFIFNISYQIFFHSIINFLINLELIFEKDLLSIFIFFL